MSKNLSFRLNKNNNNIYILNKKSNINFSLKYQKKINNIFNFKNRKSISLINNIFTNYYKWYLNSLFYSKKKVLLFKQSSVLNSNFIIKNTHKLKWRIKYKTLNIAVKKKSYKMKSLQFFFNYWSNIFYDNSYNILNFPLYKNFELSRQCLSYILIDNKKV